MFDGFSGWGIFELPKLRHGLIAVKYHSWFPKDSNKVTVGWTTENNEAAVSGRALNEEINRGAERELKIQPAPFCDDFKFEFAIDGKITSWNLREWQENNKIVQRVVELATLLDDPNYTGGETKNVELAIRIGGCGRVKNFGLTHIYWA